ncbi:MAG: hypothetical protein ACO1TE_18700 [Prosthecobacter sp.]
MSFYPEAHAQFAEAIQFGFADSTSSSSMLETGRPSQPANTAGDEGSADGPEMAFVSAGAAADGARRRNSVGVGTGVASRP